MSPVVLVHGNGESGAHWEVVRDRLLRAGFADIFAIDLDPPAHGSNTAYAAQLAAFVDGPVTAQVGATAPLAFVAHSLGVTVVREYLAHLGGTGRLARAVLIAGCSHGVPVCDAMLLADPKGLVFQQAPELHTGGAPFLAALHDAEADGGYLDRMMTISGPDDTSFALWEDSPQLDGAFNRVLPGLGHWGLRDSDRAIALTIAFLRGEHTDDGRGPLHLPADPTGRWLAADRDVPVRSLTLRPDGTAAVTDSDGERHGMWSVEPAMRDHQVDLWFGGTVRRGCFRLTADGEALGLALGRADQPRPDTMTLAPVYHRAIADAAQPAVLAGRWESADSATLGSTGLQTVRLALHADGAWQLGEIGAEPLFGGWWEADTAPGSDATWRVDLVVERSGSFLIGRGARWAWRVRRLGGELHAEMPSSTFRAPRPSLLDRPLVMSSRRG